MATIVKTGGGVPVSDYEALQAQLSSLQNSYNSLNSTYSSYRNSHAHSNDEYNNLQSSYNSLSSEYSNFKDTHSSIHIYKIGSSDSNANRTFNVSSYANYKSFTTANFYIRATGIGNNDGEGSANWRNIISSYNASTGVLTCNAIYDYENYHSRHYFLNYDVYLIDTGNITIA